MTYLILPYPTYIYLSPEVGTIFLHFVIKKNNVQPLKVEPLKSYY
jgi:hypothetical protein